MAKKKQKKLAGELGEPVTEAPANVVLSPETISRQRAHDIKVAKFTGGK